MPDKVVLSPAPIVPERQPPPASRYEGPKRGLWWAQPVSTPVYQPSEELSNILLFQLKKLSFREINC